MAYTYSHLYGLPTRLRFFTVAGPLARHGAVPVHRCHSQWTADRCSIRARWCVISPIDDIVEGVIRVLDKTATPDPDFIHESDPGTSTAPFRVFNIGNGNPTPLMDYIGALEDALGMTAEKNMMPMQPGDVPRQVPILQNCGTGWICPNTDADGVQRFVDWYIGYYGRNG